MDVSKQYIVMCEAADEIQDFFGNSDNRIGKPVYFYQYPGKDTISHRWEVYERTGLAYDEDYPSEDTKTVWLPSQEQLQDCCRGASVFEALDKFHEFVFDVPLFAEKGSIIMIKQYPSQFVTAEQLWLAYLMHSTLQKRWNGSKWEKI
ncbi:MAG: hypothetical protein IMF19_12070 [Proteobacteria bacterium]|nr:hypothetical protein [Pseudomonadota bacterium]